MSHNTVPKADMPKMASNWGRGLAIGTTRRNAVPLESCSVIPPAFFSRQSRRAIGSPITSGGGVGMEGRFLLVSAYCTPVVVHDQSDSIPDSIAACEGFRAKCS
jgi:hypothetical protein